MLCFFYIACDVSITLAEQTSTIMRKWYSGSRQSVLPSQLNLEHESRPIGNGRHYLLLNFGTNCPKVSIVKRSFGCHAQGAEFL